MYSHLVTLKQETGVVNTIELSFSHMEKNKRYIAKRKKKTPNRRIYITLQFRHVLPIFHYHAVYQDIVMKLAMREHIM